MFSIILLIILNIVSLVNSTQIKLEENKFFQVEAKSNIELTIEFSKKSKNFLLFIYDEKLKEGKFTIKDLTTRKIIEIDNFIYKINNGLNSFNFLLIVSELRDFHIIIYTNKYYEFKINNIYTFDFDLQYFSYNDGVNNNKNSFLVIHKYEKNMIVNKSKKLLSHNFSLVNKKNNDQFIIYKIIKNNDKNNIYDFYITCNDFELKSHPKNNQLFEFKGYMTNNTYTVTIDLNKINVVYIEYFSLFHEFQDNNIIIKTESDIILHEKNYFQRNEIIKLKIEYKYRNINKVYIPFYFKEEENLYGVHIKDLNYQVNLKPNSKMTINYIYLEKSNYDNFPNEYNFLFLHEKDEKYEIENKFNISKKFQCLNCEAYRNLTIYNEDKNNIQTLKFPRTNYNLFINFVIEYENQNDYEVNITLIYKNLPDNSTDQKNIYPSNDRNYINYTDFTREYLYSISFPENNSDNIEFQIQNVNKVYLLTYNNMKLMTNIEKSNNNLIIYKGKRLIYLIIKSSEIINNYFYIVTKYLIPKVYYYSYYDGYCYHTHHQIPFGFLLKNDSFTVIIETSINYDLIINITSKKVIKKILFLTSYNENTYLNFSEVENRNYQYINSSVVNLPTNIYKFVALKLEIYNNTSFIYDNINIQYRKINFKNIIINTIQIVIENTYKRLLIVCETCKKIGHPKMKINYKYQYKNSIEDYIFEMEIKNENKLILENIVRHIYPEYEYLLFFNYELIKNLNYLITDIPIQDNFMLENEFISILLRNDQISCSSSYNMNIIIGIENVHVINSHIIQNNSINFGRIFNTNFNYSNIYFPLMPNNTLTFLSIEVIPNQKNEKDFKVYLQCKSIWNYFESQNHTFYFIDHHTKFKHVLYSNLLLKLKSFRLYTNKNINIFTREVSELDKYEDFLFINYIYLIEEEFIEINMTLDYLQIYIQVDDFDHLNDLTIILN